MSSDKGRKPDEKERNELAKAGKGKKKDEEEELTAEDITLRDDLAMAVSRVLEKDPEVRKSALGVLSHEIRTATSSMTSVPKPLKFLLPFYDSLTEHFATVKDASRKEYADVLSVMAMTMAHGETESLKFKLQGNLETLTEWGHEYLRNMSGEIATEYATRSAVEGFNKAANASDLMKMVDIIVPYNISHNAGHEAVDLLIEVESLDKLPTFLDAESYERVCNYLVSMSTYMTEPDDRNALRLAYSIYQKFGNLARQMGTALRLRDMDLIKELFESQLDAGVRTQLGYMLAREQMYIFDDEDDEEGEKLCRVVRNGMRSEQFRHVVGDLDIKEAKEPEDVYKTDLSNRLPGTGTSAKQNLASTFVNGWLNCGFGNDKLLGEDGNKFIYRQKERGQMCATASLGLIHLWDSDVGCNVLDAFSYTDNENVKAGLLLGVGVVNAQAQNPFETALGMCSEGTGPESPLIVRVGAILGLGIAYAGTANTDVADVLRPIFEEPGVAMELVALAGLALGLVFVGTGNGEIAAAIVEEGFFNRSGPDLESSSCRLLCLGIGFVFLGRGEEVEVTKQTLQAIIENETVRKFAATVMDACAFAGSGNVLKVQEMLHACSEHLEEKDAMHQAAAVLAIALIAHGEPLGQQMCLRQMDHLLQYGDVVIRRSVPLALALLSVSKPDVAITEKLSKLSHDNDAQTAQSAIMALGITGAGTNNSRVATMLRNLAEFYYKDPNQLFTTRIAQGLLHLGKGSQTLSPQRQQGMFSNPSALAGLITTSFLFTDFDSLVMTRPYLLYCLTLSIQPRFLLTIDVETGEPVKCSVRVGTVVDTVGQAGKPKTLAGFQTFTTPVLLSYGEGAEMASEEWLPVTGGAILEDVIVVKKNPDYKQSREKE